MNHSQSKPTLWMLAFCLLLTVAISPALAKAQASSTRHQFGYHHQEVQEESQEGKGRRRDKAAAADKTAASDTTSAKKSRKTKKARSLPKHLEGRRDGQNRRQRYHGRDYEEVAQEQEGRSSRRNRPEGGCRHGCSSRHDRQEEQQEIESRRYQCRACQYCPRRESSRGYGKYRCRSGCSRRPGFNRQHGGAQEDDNQNRRHRSFQSGDRRRSSQRQGLGQHRQRCLPQGWPLVWQDQDWKVYDRSRSQGCRLQRSSEGIRRKRI